MSTKESLPDQNNFGVEIETSTDTSGHESEGRLSDALEFLNNIRPTALARVSLELKSASDAFEASASEFERRRQVFMNASENGLNEDDAFKVAFPETDDPQKKFEELKKKTTELYDARNAIDANREEWREAETSRTAEMEEAERTGIPLRFPSSPLYPDGDPHLADCVHGCDVKISHNSTTVLGFGVNATGFPGMSLTEEQLHDLVNHPDSPGNEAVVEALLKFRDACAVLQDRIQDDKTNNQANTDLN